MVFMDSGFKDSRLATRLALELGWWLEEANIPKWMTKGKISLIQKEPKKMTTIQQQLLTNNVSTYDVENRNRTH